MVHSDCTGITPVSVFGLYPQLQYRSCTAPFPDHCSYFHQPFYQRIHFEEVAVSQLPLHLPCIFFTWCEDALAVSVQPTIVNQLWRSCNQVFKSSTHFANNYDTSSFTSDTFCHIDPLVKSALEIPPFLNEIVASILHLKLDVRLTKTFLLKISSRNFVILPLPVIPPWKPPTITFPFA